MRRLPTGIVLAAMLALLSSAGCRKTAPPPPPAPPADDKKQWTPQEIAANPDGYLQWADRKIQGQITYREQKRKSLGDRHRQIKGRHEALSENIANAINYSARIQTQARRADDEDRWPVKVGGNSFADKDQADAAVAYLAKYVEDRKPLEADYEQAVGKLEQMIAMLGRDVEALGRAREKLGLDIERVRLNQSLDDLDRLRKTEEEIAGFDQALSKMATEESLSLDRLPTDDKASQKVDVESLLRPK